MKRAIVTLAFLFFVFTSQAYNWNLHGPAGIQATNICFVFDANGIICSDEGFYMYEDDMEWHFYSYNLPVIEVVYYSPEKMLLIMGDGSWSDGIYTFDLQTHEFEVVEWIYNPRFLRYYGYNSAYYAAGEQAGLFTSLDGINWNNVDYFDTIVCVDFAFFEENIAISEVSVTVSPLYLSNDSGATWFTSSSGSFFNDIEFNGMGNLFAVVPGLSNSAGVYQSDDYGYSLDLLASGTMITSLACDPFGHVLVGWNNGNGLARIDTVQSSPGFEFLNEGLPDTHVHAIKINPVMSAPNLFICTDSAVYHSYDYLNATEESSSKSNLKVYPNPASVNQQLTVIIPWNYQSAQLSVFDAGGKLIQKEAISGPIHIIQEYIFTPGVYYCVFIEGKKMISSKLVIY